MKSESDVVVDKNLKKYYHLFPFLNTKGLSLAYKAADLIVSRSGAGSIFEIAAEGKPSILVPLAGSAQNHQVKNAYAYSSTGAAIVIEEANFTPHFLLETIKKIFSNRRETELMSKKAEEFAKPNAARIIGDYLEAYLTQ